MVKRKSVVRLAAAVAARHSDPGPLAEGGEEEVEMQLQKKQKIDHEVNLDKVLDYVRLRRTTARVAGELALLPAARAQATNFDIRDAEVKRTAVHVFATLMRSKLMQVPARRSASTLHKQNAAARVLYKYKNRATALALAANLTDVGERSIEEWVADWIANSYAGFSLSRRGRAHPGPLIDCEVSALPPPPCAKCPPPLTAKHPSRAHA